MKVNIYHSAYSTYPSQGVSLCRQQLLLLKAVPYPFWAQAWDPNGSLMQGAWRDGMRSRTGLCMGN